MFFKGTNVPGYHPGHATGGGELGGAGKKMPSRHGISFFFYIYFKK